MELHEFENMGEFEEIKNGLARASRHPIHVDLGAKYVEAGVERLASAEFGDGRNNVIDRLERIQPQHDLHTVWNNRDDRRAYIGSSRYNLIQHREVLDAIQAAVDQTTGSIEKGIVRDYGEHIDGVLIFGDQDNAIIDVEDLVDDGYVPPENNTGDNAWASGIRDRLGLGIRFHNSFNGRSGYGGSSMAYRFICQNWMVWGEETIESKSGYHIKGVNEAPGVNSDYFEAVIEAVFEQREPLEGIVKNSIEDGELPLTWTPSVLEDVGFGRNYQKRITAQLIEWEGDDDGSTNLWNVYNAATYYIDHGRINNLGPERYNHHQSNAWKILENEPSAPDEEIENLQEFTTEITV